METGKINQTKVQTFAPLGSINNVSSVASEKSVFSASASNAKRTDYPDIDTANQKIDNFAQRQTGNCWFLASLYSLGQTEDGKKLFKEIIRKNEDGSVTITLKGVNDKQYTFTQQDIIARMNKKEFITPYIVKSGDIYSILQKRIGFDYNKTLTNNNLGNGSLIYPGDKLDLVIPIKPLSKGDVDVLLLEMAVEKHLGFFPLDGDFPSKAIDILTDKSTTVFFPATGDASLKESRRGQDSRAVWNLLNYVLNNKGEFSLVAGSVKKPPAGIIGKHAYSIDVANSTPDKIVLINPHNTKAKKVTIDRATFEEAFSFVTITDLRPYKEYAVDYYDNLSLIAKKHGVSMSSIILANPHLANIDILKPEEIIRIPKKSTK